MAATKQHPGLGKFDPINSTYIHKIYLTNDKELIGYSKGLLFTEMQDKIVLLERIIARLTKAGYLNPERTKKIEFYKQTILSKELILELRPDGYSYGTDETFISNSKIFDFLTRLYSELKQRSSPFVPVTHKAQIKTEDQTFDTSKRRFKNMDELHNFIHFKIKEGYAPGQVTQFYLEYKQKYF